MALTATVRRITRSPLRTNPQIVNAAVLYHGAYVAIGGQGHGTATSKGRAHPWACTANQIPWGWHEGIDTTGATGSSPIPSAEVDVEAREVLTLAVTGAGGTYADVGKKVYASDDGTFTLTRPSAPAVAVGFISGFVASGYAEVTFFSRNELAILALGGSESFTWLLGVVTGGAGTGNLVTGIVAPFHGKVISEFAVCLVAPTDVDLAGTINTEIGGVNVTGSAIAIAAGNTVGLKIAGAAITAANEFHEGDLIDIEYTAGTAGTAGDGLYAIYWVGVKELGL